MIPIPDETLLAQVRTDMLLDSTHPSAAFFATCAYHLDFKVNRSIDTLRTDGTTLWFNPEFVSSLSPSRRIAAFAHEVAHDAMLHPYRRGNRDPHVFNIAADHVVNIELKDAGYDIGSDWYCDEQYRGMSVDAVYAKLAHKDEPPQPEPPPEDEPEPDEQPEPEDEDEPDEEDTETPSDTNESDDRDEDGDVEGDGDSDGEGPESQPSILPGTESGDFVDADTTQQQPDADGQPGPPPMTAEDWAIVSEQAASAGRMAGSMGAGIDRAIKVAKKPATDWQNELKGFITQLVESGQSWSRPNRRFIGADTYLPGPIKDTVGEIAILVDTSGSVSQRMLDSIAEHVNVIASEVMPERIHVVYCDAEVKGAEVFEHGDEVVLKAKGGGGTKGQPAFDYLAKHEIEPLVALYMTDLALQDKPTDPGFPVLWCTPLWVTRNQPFGELLRVDIEQ